MKFYKLKTPHNQDYIDNIIKNLSSVEGEYILSIYGKLSMVEYTDENGFECMFAILDEFQISKLEDLYHRYNLKFELINLTKEIIFNEKIKTNYKNNWDRSVEKEILKLIKEFKSNWVTKDDILDKIIEKGIDSLTKEDLKILKS